MNLRAAGRVAAPVVATAVLAAVLAGCADDDPATTPPTFGGDAGAAPTAGAADVGTAALQRLREDSGIEDCPDASAPAGSSGLPAEPLPCLGGAGATSLAGLRGTPTVVNLWASWCEPCREELPVLARLDERTGDRLRVIGVDYQDPDPESALRLAADAGVRYPSVADADGSVGEALRVVALPQTVLVDADGRVVATERRAFDDDASLEAVVREHLGVAP